MKSFDIEIRAVVTVYAETEEEAFDTIAEACDNQHEDVDYNGLCTYLTYMGDNMQREFNVLSEQETDR